jgi:hypothetical protein
MADSHAWRAVMLNRLSTTAFQISEPPMAAKRRKHEWDGPIRQAGDLCHRWRDIAQHTEQTAEPHRSDSNRQSDLLVRKRGQLECRTCALRSSNSRYPARNQRAGDYTNYAR